MNFQIAFSFTGFISFRAFEKHPQFSQTICFVEDSKNSVNKVLSDSKSIFFFNKNKPPLAKSLAKLQIVLKTISSSNSNQKASKNRSNNSFCDTEDFHLASVYLSGGWFLFDSIILWMKFSEDAQQSISLYKSKTERMVSMVCISMVSYRSCFCAIPMNCVKKCANKINSKNSKWLNGWNCVCWYDDDMKSWMRKSKGYFLNVSINFFHSLYKYYRFCLCLCLCSCAKTFHFISKSFGAKHFASKICDAFNRIGNRR